MPGDAMSKAETWLFGGASSLQGTRENSFVFVFSWTCTSSPITGRNCSRGYLAACDAMRLANKHGTRWHLDPIVNNAATSTLDHVDGYEG